MVFISWGELRDELTLRFKGFVYIFCCLFKLGILVCQHLLFFSVFEKSNSRIIVTTNRAANIETVKGNNSNIWGFTGPRLTNEPWKMMMPSACNWQKIYTINFIINTQFVGWFNISGCYWWNAWSGDQISIQISNGNIQSRFYQLKNRKIK